MQNKKQAFTLVELIVVITILAILGTIAFISLQGYSADSRNSVRISDVGNMKTSLELFHLDAGKYTLPDDNYAVSYSGQTLRYQGIFGSTVVSQLSRNISEIPTDPLTEKEYIFSTANNKNEFEILTLLEGEVAYNPLAPLSGGIATFSQTNAATITVTPRIDGNYNGIFIKTPTHIVPVPSIISSELNGATLILNNTNIKSQVTNLGKNIPNVGNVTTATGQLIGLEIKEILLPAIDATPTEKAAVITLIQEAYTGCTDLVNNDIYEYILGISGEGELAGVFDTIVLNKTTEVAEIIPPTFLLNCTANGEIYYADSTGNKLASVTNAGVATWESGKSITDLTCSGHIIVCDGNNSGYTIQACNAGATTLYTTQTFAGLSAARDSTVNAWAGGLYQWGNKAEVSYTPTSATRPTCTTNSTFSQATFITGNTDWCSTQTDNVWGGLTGTNTDRQGPCPPNYHIPTQPEWVAIHTAGGWGLTNGANMQTALKLPYAGNRSRNSASLDNQGSIGIYWSSSPKNTNGYSLYFYSSDINTSSNSSRATGLSLRCLKN